MPEIAQANEVIQILSRFTPIGLRRITAAGYRQAFTYSPDGFYILRSHEGATSKFRPKIPSTTEDIENFLAQYHPHSPSRTPIMAMDGKETLMHFIILPKQFLNRVREEFNLFLCTSDSRYASLKRNIVKHTKRSQTVIITMIASAVGSRLGTEVGILTSLIALYFQVVIKIGVEAYCRE